MAGGKGRRGRRVGVGFGVIVVLLAIVWLVWRWDWFLPIVDSKASAALGRKVTAQHLHVSLGRTTTVSLDGVDVAQPDGFAAKPEFATIRRLTVKVDVWNYIFGNSLGIPLIDVDGARAEIEGHADGKMNTEFAFMKPAPAGQAPKKSSKPLKIGVLTIEDSQIDADLPKQKAQMKLDVHTTQSGGDQSGDRIVVAGGGTYAKQPITLHLVAGALLTVSDHTHPYPIDLTVANGPTKVSLVGTVLDPTHAAGAHLKLVFAGPDMSLLYPLTGVPIPSTPPYRIAGRLEYDRPKIAFRDFEGTMGKSDIGGTITVDPQGAVPQVDADLHSRNVSLVDLGGFIGAKPGNAAANKAAHAGSGNGQTTKNLLPTSPISLPKLKAANIDLHYAGGHIEGRSIPLDNLSTWITIENGDIDIHKLDFGVGRGRLASSATLKPVGKELDVDAKAELQNIDLSHLMEDSSFHGKGIVGGRIALTSRADSIAGFMANGSGDLTMAMRDGGKISALLPDVAGLEFGNALLSALGVPQQTDIQCAVVSMPLKEGTLYTRMFVFQTGEARTTGSGTVDFRTDLLHYALTTRSTHFSILSLPGAINVTGPLTSPSIAPGAEIIGRTVATVALGIAFPPAAILPTVQFGVGKSQACEQAIDAGGNAGAVASATGAAGSAGTDAGPAATPVHRTPAQIHRVWEKRLRSR